MTVYLKRKQKLKGDRMQKETNKNTHKKIQTKKSSRAREVEFNLSYDLPGSHMKRFSELSTWGIKGEAFVHLCFFPHYDVPCTFGSHNHEYWNGPHGALHWVQRSPRTRSKNNTKVSSGQSPFWLHLSEAVKAWSAGHCGARDRIKRICSGIWEVYFKGLKTPSGFILHSVFLMEKHT